MNKVGKLGSSCCMKPANATQAHMLKRMNQGLTPSKNGALPNPLCFGVGEIKAHITAQPKIATKPWAIGSLHSLKRLVNRVIRNLLPPESIIQVIV